MTSPGRLILAIALLALVIFAALVALRGASYDRNQASVDSATNVTTGRVAPRATRSAEQTAMQAALLELCTETETVTAGELLPDETPNGVGNFEELNRTASQRLSASPVAEHVHVAALLAREPTARIELIDRAVALTPDDAFLLWDAVRICAEAHSTTGCRRPDWERRLLEIDSQNSEAWIRIAANRHDAGDFDGALHAMRQAGASGESVAYWTETIELIERGLAATGDRSFRDRAGMAFGVAAIELPDYRDYSKMCGEQSRSDVEWAYACLAYGELAEKQGKTQMGVSNALSIQKLALEALGEAEALAAVRIRAHEHRQDMLDAIGDDLELSERLIFSRPAVFSSYLAAVRTHGETGARVLLVEEARRLRRLNPELACQ